MTWKTIAKSELKGPKRQIESKMVLDFSLIIPDDVRVTLPAYRGFDDHKFLEFVQGMGGFDYVIRFRNKATVTNSKGERAAQSKTRSAMVVVLRQSEIPSSPARV